MRLRPFRAALFAIAISAAALPLGSPVATATVGTCGANGVASLTSGVHRCTYTTTGADTFTVPATVTSVTVEAIGGKGGSGHSGRSGGYGADVAGVLTVSGSDSLGITVAGNGSTGGGATGGAGGSGGGGTGGAGSGNNCCGGGGGGGASSVYLSATPLVVAGGGGGGTGTGLGGAGGAADHKGHDAAFYECAGGAAGGLVGPGAGGNGGGTPEIGPDQGVCVGTNRTGGSGSGSTGGTGGAAPVLGGGAAGGGGGGGYFGGGGGEASASNDGAGGGGGSSYIDPSASSTSDVTDGTGVPEVVIRYSLPAALVYADVKDGGNGQDWSGNETPPASAYGTASVAASNVDWPTPTGTLTYAFWANANCTGSPSFTEDKSVQNDGTAPQSTTQSNLAAGSYSLRADYGGDANFDAFSSTCVPFDVSKAGQTISYSSAPPAIPVVGGTYNPSATATSSLGVGLSIAAGSGLGTCTYSAPTVTFTGAGTCIIAADQAGNTTYSAAPTKYQAFTVYPASGGSITTTTTAISAGATARTIVFTYTAPASGMSNGTVRLSVPAGWSAPSTSSSAAGYVTSGPGTGVSVSSRTITVSGVTLAGGATLPITYGARTGTGPGATAPTTTGSSGWMTQQRTTAVGSFGSLSAPVIPVVAADGSGTLTASRSSVTHSATHQTIVFTFKVATGGINSGSVTIRAPAGWSVPSLTKTAPGYVTSSAGVVTISGRTITISGLTKGAGKTITLTYGSRAAGGPGATVTSTKGTQTWTATEKSSSGGTLKALSASPRIKVL